LAKSAIASGSVNLKHESTSKQSLVQSAIAFGRVKLDAL
jgi:hypothetical protein